MENTGIHFLSEDNKLIALIVDKRYRWVRHLLLWLLLLVSYNSMLVTFMGNLQQIGNNLPYLTAIQFLLYIGAAYINIYILMPKLFLQGKYATYFFSLIGILTLVFMLGYLMEYLVIRKYPFDPGLMSYMHSEHNILIDYISDISVMAMCCAGTSLTLLFRNWLLDGKRRKEMETKQLRSKVEKVKTSINSRFMSDVLAAAADMALTDSVKSVDVLSRLSRFLRYRLYDSRRSIVMLNSEVLFLDNYLSLIRDIGVNLTYSIKNQSKAKSVPPSLLISVTDLLLEKVVGAAPVNIRITLCDSPEKMLSVKVDITGSDISSLTADIPVTIDSIPGVFHISNQISPVGQGSEKYEIVMGFKTDMI